MKLLKGATLKSNTDRAVGIVKNGNSVLLFHRRKKEREYFYFPGGGVEKGETLEQALYREILEEVNLEVHDSRHIVSLRNRGRHEHYFIVDRFAGQPALGPEQLEKISQESYIAVVWKSLQEIFQLNVYPPEILPHIYQYALSIASTSDD